MSSVIVIMGRPNVGKSTLFNRLVRRRDALVDPQPGLTRDSRQRDCIVGGQEVSIIDTAGLESSQEKMGLSTQMTKQALKAVDIADLVLFVVDARSGVIPADEEWAQLLRKRAKKIMLIANKCESEKNSSSGKIDALRLGLGQPLSISAEHDLGIADLEEEIVEHLKETLSAENETAKSPRGLKMAIIGRPNAGKSSLVNYLLGEERQLTGAQPGITRDAIGIDWKWQGEKIVLFDTAGIRRKARIFARVEKLSVSSALQAIRFADVVVLLMDTEKLFETQDLRLADFIIREGRAPVLAVNKIDLMPEITEADIKKSAQNYLPQMRGVPIACLSAKTGKGVDCLMSKIMEANEMWNKQINTSALNAWLRSCVMRNPPPAVRKRPTRIKYITQKSVRPPSFIIFTSREKKLPKDYMRFLINDMRESFGFGGTPLRLDVRASVNPYI